LKTAIVRGIAQRVADGTVPRRLMGKDIYSLDVKTIMENTGWRGTLEAKVKAIIDAARSTGAILFIDEVHGIVGAGGMGGQDIANQFKPSLADGSISMIGATTEDEYRKYIETDSALSRRMSPVQVNEATIAQAADILKGLKDLYEAHHMVTIPEEVCDMCSSFAKVYMTDRILPDSAIDVLDISCIEAARRSRSAGTPTVSVREWKDMVGREEFGRAAANKPAYRMGREALVVVSVSDVEVAVESLSRRKVYSSEALMLDNLGAALKDSIVGQDKSIDEVCSVIRSGYLYPVNAVLGAVLLVGEHGTGRSLLASLLSSYMFNGKIVTIDMAEFSQDFSMSGLIGPPPGYVGYDKGGRLTGYVHSNPSCVVVIDNVERASSAVHKLVSELLDTGKLVDTTLGAVSFAGTFLVLTTSSEVLVKPHADGIGFATKTGVPDSSKVMKKVKDIVSEDISSKLSAVVIFNDLTVEDMKSIIDLEVGKINNVSRGPSIDIDDGAKDLLLANWDPKTGARYAGDVIREKVLSAVANMYSKNGTMEHVSVGTRDGELDFSILNSIGSITNKED
jgi:ATP-dependent Clp protease ATP-binding subunit ClpA